MSFDLPFELPNGWELKTVEQLVNEKIIEKPLDGNHGGIHPKSSDYVEEGIPFVMASDLEAGRVDFHGCKFVTEQQANTLRKGFSRAGDVLISHKATIGRTAIVQESNYPFIMLTPQVTYYRVTDEERLSNIYLKAYFDSHFFQSLLALWAGAGSTRAYLGITGQLNLPVILPPIDMQIFIANHAFTLDKKIETNRQTNQTLEQIAQAIFKSWFVDFDPVKAKIAVLEAGGTTEQAELAAMSAISAKDETALKQLQAEQPEHYAELAQTAALFPSMMVDSEFGEIPEGWNFSNYSKLCQKIESGGTPRRGESSYWNGAIKWLSSGEVRDVIAIDTKEKITEIGLKESSAKLWPKLTTVIAMYGATAGQVCLLAEKMSSNQACCGLIPYPWLNSYVFLSARREIESLANKASGSAQQNLNKGIIESHGVIEPPKDVASFFDSKVKSLIELWIGNVEQNNQLGEIRDTLLPKLLSGELIGE